jgi:hypothetical protein
MYEQRDNIKKNKKTQKTGEKEKKEKKTGLGGST